MTSLSRLLVCDLLATGLPDSPDGLLAWLGNLVLIQSSQGRNRACAIVRRTAFIGIGYHVIVVDGDEGAHTYDQW
jgi:hypothetical protein